MAWLRTPDFSLRQLQYAVAVAEEGGFGRAAAACGVSQPALSAQVAKLEAALGTPLFERRPRGVIPTGMGRALLPRLRDALEAAHGVDVAARALVAPASVTLRVGVIPTIAPYVVPGVVERLRGREDLPRLHWIERTTADCEAALSQGELDAILIADPPTGAEVDHVDVGFEPFWLVTPPDQAPDGAVAVRDVADDELLLLEDGHCLRDHTMALCMKPGAEGAPFVATSLPTLVQMVASGFGTSVLPASAVAVERSRARIGAAPFADPAVGRVLRLAWRSRCVHADTLRTVGGVLGAVLGEAVAAAGVDVG